MTPEEIDEVLTEYIKAVQKDLDETVNELKSAPTVKISKIVQKSIHSRGRAQAARELWRIFRTKEMKNG